MRPRVSYVWRSVSTVPLLHSRRYKRLVFGGADDCRGCCVRYPGVWRRAIATSEGNSRAQRCEKSTAYIRRKVSSACCYIKIRIGRNDSLKSQHTEVRRRTRKFAMVVPRPMFSQVVRLLIAMYSLQSIRIK